MALWVYPTHASTERRWPAGPARACAPSRRPNAGGCAVGCPSVAKQHTGVTYVPKAWAAGARTYTGARVEGVDVHRGAARAVTARTRGGGRPRVECEHVVLAAGRSTRRCSCAGRESG